MTDAELEARLRAGRLLFVDTSAAHANRLFGLANDINQLNAKGGPQNQLAMSALVYEERRKQGAQFNPAIVRSFLVSKQIEVVAYEAGDAEVTAEWLAKCAPTSEDWRRLKWARVTGELRASGSATRRLSATVDWFIIGHAVAREGLLVTDDKGVEFAYYDETAPYKQVRRVLKSLLGP